MGDQHGVATVLNHLAISQGDMGRRAQASRFHLVAKQLFQVLGDQHMEAIVAFSLFRLRFSEGRHRESREMGEHCLRVFVEQGDVLNTARTYHGFGLLETYLGRYQQALDSYQAAWRGYWSAGSVPDMIRCTGGVGSSLLALGRVDEAEETLEAGRVQARSQALPMPESPLLRYLGDVRVAQGRFSEARELYHEALRVRVRTSDLNEGMCWSRLGDLSGLEGDADQALAHWRRAARILHRIPTPYSAGMRFKIAACMYVREQTPS